MLHDALPISCSMLTEIGKIYKHSQSQLSTSSLKAPFISSSDPQTSSAIKLTTTSVPSVTDKNQNNSVLYSKNTTQNDTTITNNDNIQSCEAARKKKYSIPSTSTPNNHTICIATKSSSILNLNTPTILPPVVK